MAEIEIGVIVLFKLVEIQEFTNYPRKYDEEGTLVRGYAPGRLFQQIRDNPKDLAEVAWRTKIVSPRRDNSHNRAKRDRLLDRLREIVNAYRRD